MRSGHLSAAEQAYAAALLSAQRAFAGPNLFTPYYHLGRVKRFLCKDDEAESLLRKSIEHGEKIQIAYEAFKGETTKAIFELARLYYDQERYSEVVPLMEKGFRMIEGMNVERKYPAAYAYALGQYADALRNTNRQSEAKVIEGKANALRARPDVRRDWAMILVEFERECKGVAR